MQQKSQKQSDKPTTIEKSYEHLTAWQTVQVARHKDRPYAADYIRLMCDDFFELHGDRIYGDDQSILAGPAQFNGSTVMFICHQKGRDSQQKLLCNFGMAHPEGYRKAIRLMKQAEKFRFPVVYLIDTPGASPTLEDEQREQSWAIANSLYTMSSLRVPTIAVVIGEGGGEGALAMSVADRLLMLEHSIYTVASPEAAASILWSDATFAPQAAESMQIRAQDLLRANFIDEIIIEPSGGAHHDYNAAANTLKAALCHHLSTLKSLTPEALIAQRHQKFRDIGPFSTIPSVMTDISEAHEIAM